MVNSCIFAFKTNNRQRLLLFRINPNRASGFFKKIIVPPVIGYFGQIIAKLLIHLLGPGVIKKVQPVFMKNEFQIFSGVAPVCQNTH